LTTDPAEIVKLVGRFTGPDLTQTLSRIEGAVRGVTAGDCTSFLDGAGAGRDVLAAAAEMKRLPEVRCLGLSSPRPHCDRDRSGGFGRERQPARRRHRKPGHLGDNGAEAAVTDPFLEARQHRFLVAGVDVDHAVRTEADLSQRRRKQVLPGNAPQDFALGPGRDAGGEPGGRGAVDGGIAISRHFVQRPERQPTQRRPLKALNLLAVSSDGRWLDRDTHVLLNALAESLFLLCPSISQ
jgi:hypothetical protein